MLVMRSLLFVPANRANMVAHAHETPADVIVLDLENAVPPAEKDSARQALRPAIESLKVAGKTVHVRVNHLDTGLTRDDLAAAIGPSLDGLVFPNTKGGQDIRYLDVQIREQELRNGVRAGTVALIPHVESARGVLNCEEIVKASPRIAGLALDSYDYALDLGVARTRESHELEYARRVIVHCCAAYGIVALDGPFGDFGDEAGLVTESRYVRSIGFKGKYVIHPSQVGAVNDAFVPTSVEVEQAHRVVTVFEEALAAGHGTAQLNGRVVHATLAQGARELIAYATELEARQAG